MNRFIKSGLYYLLLITGILIPVPQKAQDELVKILAEELHREMSELSKQNPAPYYIDYRVDDITSHNLRASFGSIVGENNSKQRELTVMVRVGDYSFDNTHELQGNFSMSEQMEVLSSSLPLENESDAIKQVIWRITDQAYKNAASKYTSLKNMKLPPGDTLADFSKEAPAVYYDQPYNQQDLQFNEAEWKKRLKKYTSLFSHDSLIFHSEASVNVIFERKYLLTSEGSSIVQSSNYAQVQFAGTIRHSSGVILPLQKSYTAFRVEDLPSHESMLNDFQKLYTDLVKMKDAVMAEPYAGPAILSPAAAGVFFHEIFGHRIEGHRLESLDDGQTFKDKVGSEVLPEDFQVYSDPTLWKWQGQDLIGAYKFDDQGIPAQPVTVADVIRLLTAQIDNGLYGIIPNRTRRDN